MSGHRRVLKLAGLIAALCVIAHGLQPANPELLALLYLLPALLLALVLFTGRYPGERVLKRLRKERSFPSPRCLNSRAPRQHPTRVLRGGRLIAVCLAGRAPPLAPVCR